jgi:Chromate transporter
LFIFLGAPYVERLRGNHTLSAALTGITAAVVGVIANLALYFAVHTLFAATNPWRWGPVRLQVPDLASLRPVPLAIAAARARDDLPAALVGTTHPTGVRRARPGRSPCRHASLLSDTIRPPPSAQTHRHPPGDALDAIGLPPMVTIRLDQTTDRSGLFRNNLAL